MKRAVLRFHVKALLHLHSIASQAPKITCLNCPRKQLGLVPPGVGQHQVLELHTSRRTGTVKSQRLLGVSHHILATLFLYRVIPGSASCPRSPQP